MIINNLFNLLDRRYAFLIFFLFCAFAVSGQGKVAAKPFSLSGKVIGRDTGGLILHYRNAHGETILDTASLSKGMFKFTGEILEPIIVALFDINATSLVDDPERTTFYIESGDMTIELNDKDFKDFTITGSATQQSFDRVLDQKKPLWSKLMVMAKERDSISKVIKALGSSTAHEDKLKRLDEEWDGVAATLNRIDLTYTAAHPDSYLSPYLLSSYNDFKIISKDSVTNLFKKFSPEVKSSRLGRELFLKLDWVDKSDTGAVAVDFTGKDRNGKRINLAEFRDKNYVLIDFWASWCVPCVNQLPALKKFYSKYQSAGLKVISISSDSSRDLWLKSIAIHQTGNWIHILKTEIEPNKADPELDITLQYNSSVIPTIILINKQGKIIYRKVSYDGNPNPDGLQAAMLKDLAEK